MNSKDIAQLIASGTPQVFSIDRKHKTHLQQGQLTDAIAAAKRALTQNKDVIVVLVVKRG
jgi:hypothetical protein